MKNFLFEKNNLASIVFLFLLLIIPFRSFSQGPWQRILDRPTTLGLENGFIEFNTPQFDIKLVKSSQTVAALRLAADGFDFTPHSHLELRSRDSLYHLGDIRLRVRKGDDRNWVHYSSGSARKPVDPIAASGNVKAAADLSNTFPEHFPLKIVRKWVVENGDLILRFDISNKSDFPVEVGSVGIPLIFNNILYRLDLEQAHAQCVFYDPYIGLDAGYLQVIRLHGQGPVLLVLPHTNAAFEAYNPLLEDRTPRSITFEGFHEWMIHSRAHAETDWSQAEPWNRPTSYRLNPGEERTHAIRLVLSESIRGIEHTLQKHKRPVAVGIPGYVIPKDIGAKLFLRYQYEVRTVDVEPAGALKITRREATPGGWEHFMVQGLEWGRARLTVTFNNGLRQTIHYNVIEPEEDVVASLGRFHTTEKWYENPEDLFGRSPSVITFDYETWEHVLQDGRAWIAGLSDEGGAGAWLAAIMKQLIQPDKTELERLRRFFHETLWGGIQISEGENKHGVRNSLFMYEPDEFPPGTYREDINWNTWAAWNRERSQGVGRSYNYVHVAAAHWAFYRISRFHKDLIPEKTWEWYLEQAYHTVIAMVEQAPTWARWGQMGATVYLYILHDLKREGKLELAQSLENAMRKRMDFWNTLPYPFGSEMPWDSTGQEEVYAWSKFFGYYDKADITLNAILAYMPTVPHWGYNGSARRYWDFIFAGKAGELSRIERQLHHYGSGLNAIPVLSEFRKNPDDLYLLRVGHAGVLGAISNITRDGFAPAAFHSFPSTLRINGISGDFGSGFLAYSIINGTYVYQCDEFGWLSFSGEIESNGSWKRLTPKSGANSRVFIAPLGLWLTLDAGRFQKIEFNPRNGRVRIFLEEKNEHLSEAVLRIEQPATVTGIGSYSPRNMFTERGGAFIIPLTNVLTSVELTHR
ncbi:MAG TPA: DUF5695 domain-containing protein [Bacteroidales bacterium]|nr:DUF5695 domain-containing protein [Bacteroidales bacterium]